MKKNFWLIILSSLFNLLLSSNAQAQTDALAQGQQLYAFLSGGNGDTLFKMMTPKFQTAVGGQEGFSKLMKQLPADLGSETKMESEAAFQEAGYNTYYRISQFEKAPSVTTRFVWKDKELHGLTVRPSTKPAPSAYLDYKTKTALQLPFQGTWYVAWGGREPHLNYHVVAPDQRFAYDFLYAKDGKLFEGTPQKLEDYYGFGQPVYAPAGGTVIIAVDSVADNAIGVTNSQSPPGNYVIIDHNNGEYSLLAHFKRGTVAVKKGDTVKAGALLGQCGNSGQSTQPHLHYHLQTGTDYRKGEGLPIFFNQYQSNGQSVKLGEPVRGQYISR